MDIENAGFSSLLVTGLTSLNPASPISNLEPKGDGRLNRQSRSKMGMFGDNAERGAFCAKAMGKTLLLTCSPTR
ncbi:MAG: hypothetical protein P8J33_17500 [Pirellulaceae bacterium]|nr:hypothetical protein [Pirellulaceae bacterium]